MKTKRTKNDSNGDVDLQDLGKAGEHFIMGAAELVVATGYAIKGVKNLLDDKEGRKFVRDFPIKMMERGFEVVKEIRDNLDEKERSRTKKPKRGSKRNRKIDVE